MKRFVTVNRNETFDAGMKIQLIKKVRELSGIGLKEAKDFVELVLNNGAYDCEYTVRNNSLYASITIKREYQPGDIVKIGVEYARIVLHSGNYYTVNLLGTDGNISFATTDIVFIASHETRIAQTYLEFHDAIRRK